MNLTCLLLEIKKETLFYKVSLFSTESGNRTHTPKEREFESRASTNSAISAKWTAKLKNKFDQTT